MSSTVTIEKPRSADIQESSPAPLDHVPQPSLLGMAASFTVAAVRHVADGLQEVTPEQKAERLAACRQCPYASAGRCGVCGCFLEKKAAWRTQDCPLGKWASVTAETNASATRQPWSPKLRSDLVITRQESPQGTVYLVKDPREGSFVRLREAEHFIATQFDGQKGLDEIRRLTEERFDSTLSATVLERFIVKLRSLGFLEADGGESPPPAAPRRVRGSLLHLRVKLFDPDRVLGWLAHFSGPLFSRTFVFLGVLLCVAAIWLVASEWSAVQRDLLRITRPETLPTAFGVLLAVILLHEMSHGLACKRFGGAVHEIGLLLIYFQPAFYCDVSSAWQFQKKSERLWVTFAGAFSELLVWAAATFVWKLTAPHAWINTVALIVMATSGVKTLFNLNPLIKLDGYYLLSDWLEISNLRAKAFQRLRELAGFAIAPNTPQLAGPREGRLLLIYGLLAATYSAALLAWVGFKAGEYLMGRYQAIGFAAFSMLVGFFLYRMWPRPVPTSGADSLRRGRLYFKWAVAMILIAGTAAAASQWHPELRVAGEFTILPIRRVEVRSQVEGLVAAILVKEGDRVCEGQVLARLDDRTLRGDLDSVSAQVRQQQAHVRELEAGPRAEAIVLARSAVETAAAKVEAARRKHAETVRSRAEKLIQTQAAVDRSQAELGFATNRVRRCQLLVDRKVLPQEDLDIAREKLAVLTSTLVELESARRLVELDDLQTSEQSVDVAEAEYQEAQSRLNLLDAGTRSEELDAAQAELDGLLARQKTLTEQVRSLDVVSPLVGVVTSRKLSDKTGQHMIKGTVIAEIQQVDRVTAEIRVPEHEIGDIQPGQTVLLRSRAYPERSFAGTVRLVSLTTEQGTDGETSRMVVVETTIPNGNQLLKSGMTGRAKICCGQRSFYDLSLRRIARTVNVEFWSWW